MMIVTDTPEAVAEKITGDAVSTAHAEVLDENAVWNGGFPAGYFIIRSVANGRVLDVEGNDKADGAAVILYPQMETSLIESASDTSLSSCISMIFNHSALLI